MRYTCSLLLILFTLFCSYLYADNEFMEPIYVGFRSSYYGLKPFPSPDETVKALVAAAEKFPQATPSAVWIIGGLRGDAREKTGYCQLEFPNPDSVEYPFILFEDEDKHTPYLNAFDSAGVKVFLQVEAGMADMPTLIQLIFDKYGHHKSVVGFGIDLEWYPSPVDKSENYVSDTSQFQVWSDHSATATNFLRPIKRTEVEKLDALVKAYDPSYRIFLKHWEAEMCGGKPISDVIYVNDGQRFQTIDLLTDFFTEWSEAFYPNEVGFQIGYPTDKPWWGKMQDPLKEVGNHLIKAFPQQKVHLFWVDFTVYDLTIWN